ncbi:MAG: DUF1800 family protein [Rikenellaceae bacterium]
MKHLLFCALLALFNLQGFGANQIDKLVDTSLKSEKITPSEICSDEVYVRRLYLILIGKLPTANEAIEFIDSESKTKRKDLATKLLSTTDYVDFQVVKWGDLLKIKSEFPSNLWPNGVQAYNRWVREKISANTPYDQFVRDLLLCSGSNFRTPQVNFYRAFVTRTPETIAENVEMLFLGSRTLSKEAPIFFSQVKYKSSGEWKEEIVYTDLDIAPEVSLVTMSDGKKITLNEREDLRESYVAWLTSKENRQFARAMANRIWYWMMGRGVVHEADDFRADNPASNPKLLEHLTDEFIKSGYDIRKLMAMIVESNTFQRSSISNESNKSDVALFSHYPTIRLTAEQIIDGLSALTGINDRYVSRVPEPYSYYPSDMTSTDIGDATVSSPQLDLFGRPSRDFSLENQRVNDLNSKQTLYLLNATSINTKISTSKLITQMVEKQESREDVIREIYLMMLSRRPSAEETAAILSYVKSNQSMRAMASDLIWAMLNSPEYLFNH